MQQGRCLRSWSHIKVQQGDNTLQFYLQSCPVLFPVLSRLQYRATWRSRTQPSAAAGTCGAHMRTQEQKDRHTVDLGDCRTADQARSQCSLAWRFTYSPILTPEKGRSTLTWWCWEWSLHPIHMEPLWIDLVFICYFWQPCLSRNWHLS